MSGTTQRKLKSKIICERTLDDVSEGTSARTRPLTYDEIMLRRKSKKDLEGSAEEVSVAETTRHEENVRNLDYQSRDLNEAAKKNSQDHQRESSPRKRVEMGSRTERTHSKSENKERHDVENSRVRQRDSSPRKKTEHTHIKSENKERRDVQNSRDYHRESSPRKVEKRTRMEHTQSKNENKGRNDVENSRDFERESSPRKMEKGSRMEPTQGKYKNKERHVVDNSKGLERELSPKKKMEKSTRMKHTHSKSENKERRDAENSRGLERESSPRKMEKSTRTEHIHSKSENKERRDVENSRGLERESSPRKKMEKSTRTEHTHSKSENKERRDVENSRGLERESSPKKNMEKSTRTEHTHSKSENKERRDVENSRGLERESSLRKKMEKSTRTEHTDSKSENKERRDVENQRDHLREYSPRKRVETGSRMEYTHSKSDNKEKCDVENPRDYLRESSPRKEVEKSSRTERTHGKVENKEKRDAESRSKHKHDNDVRNASESNNDRQGRMRSKPEVYSRDNYENKHRDSAAQDRHLERNGGAADRENKRRDRSGDDEMYRLRDPVKKHDSGSRWDSENSERKKTEPSHSRVDESRSKRRRSRSQERTKEKARKSSSSSPKAHKVVLDHVHDHVEPSLRSERERSRRHSDVDRSKMPSDGSSSHHRRHGGSSCGLGGYSPRKRKSEAAVKTPSPIRSPDRKNAGWNLPPSGADKNPSTTVPSGTQLISQPKPSNMTELAAGVSVASSMGRPISAILSNNYSVFKQASMDSVQLTQATRPMRRLYIDNIPGSATEKEIMECFNTFLLSSGSNYIRGAHPCISCMIHKEKGQALVEFLTPEDASAALAFDGRSLSGCVLKIRRPKDFVEVPARLSGSSEKSKAREESISEVSISNIVKDSPHKIFVGGIAEGLSSEMFMEIASAFGTLKAYRFDFNKDLKEPCAFLEYADQSVTLKACAGLNCMKLGDRVLTVTQAVPITESLESSGGHPFYGIPEHVKPLLEKPTQVLELKNLLDEKALDSLSETDLEEIVKDVRLECSRFGSVVSINVARGGKAHTSISEAKDVTYDIKPSQTTEERIHQLNESPTEVAADHDEGDDRNGELLCTIKEFDAVDADKLELAPASISPGIEAGVAGTSIVADSKEADKTSPQNCDDKADNDLQEAGQAAVSGVPTTDDLGVENDFEGNHQDLSIQESGVFSELNSNGSLGIEKSGKAEKQWAEAVSELGKSDDTPQEVATLATNSGVTDKDSNIEDSCDINGKEFEVGCVLVEFRRTEASCMAAHCLHGRTFDDRIVTIEYVPLKAYRAKFPK